MPGAIWMLFANFRLSIVLFVCVCVRVFIFYILYFVLYKHLLTHQQKKNSWELTILNERRPFNRERGGGEGNNNGFQWINTTSVGYSRKTSNSRPNRYSNSIISIDLLLLLLLLFVFFIILLFFLHFIHLNHFHFSFL